MYTVSIDPGGFLLHPWMAVLVPPRTGVHYEHQTGGTACLHRRIERHYVPVFNQEACDSLGAIFEVTLKGAGTRRGSIGRDPCSTGCAQRWTKSAWTRPTAAPAK